MDLSIIDKEVVTPELDVVRVVSVLNESVLLVKEVDDINWKLPGGKVHSGETIFEALVRELSEELGIQVDREDILTYCPAKIPHSKNTRHIFLLKSILKESILTTKEVEESDYFRLDSLPKTKFKEHIISATNLALGT